MPGETQEIAKPFGRPTLYQDTYPDQVYKLAMLGLTDLQIAEFFGVSHQTIYNWQEEHPDFLESSMRGKTLADAEMAVSLYRRGIGYSHEAVKIFMPAGAEEPVYAKYIEHYPPDTPAASLWLRNRQKALWRDTQSLQQLDKDGNPTDGPVRVQVILVGEAPVQRVEATPIEVTGEPVRKSVSFVG